MVGKLKFELTKNEIFLEGKVCLILAKLIDSQRDSVSFPFKLLFKMIKFKNWLKKFS